MGSRLAMPGGNDWDPDAATTMVAWALADLATKQRDLSVGLRPQANVIRPLSPAALTSMRADNNLQALADGLQQPLDTLYASRGWGGVAWGFYGTILRSLETTFNFGGPLIPTNLRNPVYAFGYDFRRSNFDSGDALIAFIADVLQRNPGAAQVVIVTHSMGGLVMRAAMVRNPGIIASIRGVIHGAQPANGAVVAYRRFFTGATSQLDGTGAPDRVIEAIIGTSPIEYATLQSGLPGPMQLLPNHLFQRFSGGDPWLMTSPPLDLSTVYSIYALPTPPGLLLTATLDDLLGTAMVNAGLLQRIATALAFHQALSDTGHPNTHVMFSTDRKTDAQVDFTQGLSVVQTPSGDGTVPESSGACLNIRASFVKSRHTFSGLEHSGVFADDVFNATVVRTIKLVLSAKN
jgi:pimeloyl-ACP methyl ester carboxylesterase